MHIECTKTRFATEKDAAFYITKIKIKSTRDVIPTRSYLCRCGAWHLTSRKDYVAENTILLQKVSALEEQIRQLQLENELFKNKNKISDCILLEHQIKKFQSENNFLKNETNKELNVDTRIIELKNTINDKNRTISTLRKDSEKLIIKILQLEKKTSTHNDGN